MPYVLVHNRPAIEETAARLARWLDLPGGSFSAVLDWVMELRTRFDIPHTAADLGVEECRLEDLAAMAAADPTAGTNPVPIGQAEILEMYRLAMVGQLDSS